MSYCSIPAAKVVGAERRDRANGAGPTYICVNRSPRCCRVAVVVVMVGLLANHFTPHLHALSGSERVKNESGIRDVGWSSFFFVFILFSFTSGAGKARAPTFVPCQPPRREPNHAARQTMLMRLVLFKLLPRNDEWQDLLFMHSCNKIQQRRARKKKWC